MEYYLGFFIGILPALLSFLFVALFLPFKKAPRILQDFFLSFWFPFLLYVVFYYLVMNYLFGW